MKHATRDVFTALTYLALSACADRTPPSQQAGETSASTPVHAPPGIAPADSTGDIDPASVIDRPIVLYIEATTAELEAARKDTPGDDFAVIADDLMFYRSSAIEYLERERIRFQRVEGRRPLQFLVNGSPTTETFSGIELFDFVVVYDGHNRPRVVPPNEIERVNDTQTASTIDN